jgi:2-iminobutanoate/2-iminopropanoate deaminase
MNTGKKLPQGATQHKTAGPYSPVLEVDARRIVVISGQAPIDPEGNVVGTSIEEQTEYTLQNCEKQLQSAGVGLENVFKTNLYLTDLSLWQRCNAVYEKIMPKPFPARTAVQAGLLMTFLVEIEMWASKPES